MKDLVLRYVVHQGFGAEEAHFRLQNGFVGDLVPFEFKWSSEHFLPRIKAFDLAEKEPGKRKLPRLTEWIALSFTTEKIRPNSS